MKKQHKKTKGTTFVFTFFLTLTLLYMTGVVGGVV